MANATIVGRICIIDDPESAGRDAEITKIETALVIEFDDVEELRACLRTGQCTFKVLGKDAAE